MNNSKTILAAGVIGLLLGLIVSPTIMPGYNNESYQGYGHGRGMMMGGGYGSQRGNIDQHFIEQMIPHHQGAIDMAKLALTRGQHPEIKSLAQGIIEAQQREIDDMKGWYKNWFGENVPDIYTQDDGNNYGMMHMGSMTGDLDDLKNANDFDREFIRQMIPHHEMAIMMASMLRATTNRPEMKTLADQIITSQSREIKMMVSWAKAWN